MTHIAKYLLAWYEKNKRDLPWRHTQDAYCILLSEFMLQQTQVDTVIPYYHRFLARFPTLRDLAHAPQSDVLKAWEGLGYYARARNLQKAMQKVVEQYNGKIPDIYEDLHALPGFGPYTTAAVLSIAFNQNCAVLDGNVMRVLCRLFNIHDDITHPCTKKHLWQLAQELLPRGHAGAYNQAIMELGATVCTPRNPDCATCPLNAQCKAYPLGHPESLPIKAKKKPRPHHTLGAGIVWYKNKVLITRRPENGLLGGLWEFPAGTQQNGESLQETCIRGIQETAGITVKILNRFRTVNHAFTHFSITIHAFLCTHQKGKAHPVGCAECAWVSLSELHTYAFSRTSRKLADYLQQTHQPDLFVS